MYKSCALVLALVVASGSLAAARTIPAQQSHALRPPAASGRLDQALSLLRRAGSLGLSKGAAVLRSCYPQRFSNLRGAITSLITRVGLRSKQPRITLGARAGIVASTRAEANEGGGTSLWTLQRAVARTSSGKAQGEGKDKDWTVFVYLNGDNNIHEPMIGELADLAEVGSTGRINVVALWDGSKAYGRGDGWDGSKLLLVEKGGTKVLQDFGELDMASPETLEKSLSLVMKKFPSQRTALIVGNHGFGWRGVSGDDSSGAAMPVDGVGAVLDKVVKSTGQKLDLLGYDACLMNIAEANYPVRKAAKVLVASQQLEYAHGWDWNGILSALDKQPTMDGKQLAKTIVQTYGKAYSKGGCYSKLNCAVTLSAIDLEKFDGAMQHVDAFAEALKGGSRGMEKEVIGAALQEAQRFSDPRGASVDLVDFTRRVGAKTNDPIVKASAARLGDYLTTDLIIANAAVSPNPKSLTVDNAHGMSIYFPGGFSYQDGYATYKAYQRGEYVQLSMSNESKWREMLDAYYPPNGNVIK